MLEVDQAICNKIAAQKTQHSWVNELLKIKDVAQGWEAEDKLWAWILRQAKTVYPENPTQLAAMVAAILPALMENKAIAAYLETEQDQWVSLPLVSSPEEAAELAGMDKNLGPDEPVVKKAAELLAKIQAGELTPNLTSLLPRQK